MKRQLIKEPDIFDILSATWILASNDENPIITYEGIRHRLGLSSKYDIKGIIQSRGELFRKGVPNTQLDEWKAKMRVNKYRPSWIKDIDDDEARKSAIENIKPDDVFRSQFRTEKSSPQSPIEIINWGLEHIERLRKASIEKYAQSAKRWEIWLVFTISVINIIVTIGIAFLCN